MTVAMYRGRDQSARRGGILTRSLPQSHAVDRSCVGNVVRAADRQIRRDIPQPWATIIGRPAPTPAVTPRVTAANAPTLTPAPLSQASAPTPAPSLPPAPPPTPEPTPTPQQQIARIFNTAGLGVWVHLQPGPQAPRARVLKEGTRVLLTGNDETIAARPWREIETEDHIGKGWVQGDFMQLLPPPP